MGPKELTDLIKMSVALNGLRWNMFWFVKGEDFSYVLDFIKILDNEVAGFSLKFNHNIDELILSPI